MDKQNIIVQDYDIMYKLFKEGKISIENWQLYCESVLKVLMTKYHDILIRLKF